MIGPTLGGWITDNYSWRWIFLINLPIGIMSLLLTSLLIYDPPFLQRARKFTIDYMGLGLMTCGLAFLEIVLDEGQRQDWFSSRLIVFSAFTAVICLVSTVVWELRHKDPVIDLHLLKERNFALSVMSMFLLGFVLYGSTMLLPVFLQTLLGYSSLTSGLVLSPGGLAIIACMPLVGFLIAKVQARWLVIFGLLVSAYGTFMMSHFNLEVDFRHALISRIIQSAGLAFLFVPINTMAFAQIARERTSYATGLINLARNIGGSAGIATMTTMLARGEQLHQNVLVGHITPLNPAYNDFMAGASQVLNGVAPAQAMLYGLVQRQAAMLAFIDNFRLIAYVFLAIIPLMLLMRRTDPHKGPMVME